MATDMDIDMDMDIDFDIPTEDFEAVQPEPILTAQSEVQTISNIAPPNDSSHPEALVQVPNKVHLRGLDNLKSSDINLFAKSYFPDESIDRIEWINDSSANLVYADADVARNAIIAFAADDVSTYNFEVLSPEQAFSAKDFPGHAEINLAIRLAVNGDRKQAGARDRSRFYLLNPEYDPENRKKREGERGGRGGQRRYRDREEGEYQARRFNGREQRRREEDETFDVSLYDDDKETRAARANKRSSTSSPEDMRRSRDRSRGERELFPDRAIAAKSRNRSASPDRSTNMSGTMRSDAILARKRVRNEQATTRNRSNADLIRNTLKQAAAAPPRKRELFPQKSDTRSAAFDIADQATNKFANIGLDGASDAHSKPPDLMSRISRPGNAASSGMNIKGGARQGMSIKGMANSAEVVRELFPMMAGNSGKELFGKKLDGRGAQRSRAEDLFR